MNWYKQIKLSTSRTLYHGTSIDNYNSIKSIGLVPDVGGFVSDSYAGEYDAAGVEFDPTPLVYATDKEELQKAVNAMQYAVAKMLNRGWGDISVNDLKNYGILVILKQGEDDFERRPVEEEGPWKDWQGETDNRYPAVEPGDYFSEYSTEPPQILIGNKMVDFLIRNQAWLYESPEELRQQLLTMAIRYHIKETPERRDEIIPIVQEKINGLDEETVKQYYKLYSEKIKNELV